MAKDNGGVIGVLNTPTSTSASGVWQLMSEYQARLSGTWPAPFNLGSSSARFNSGSSDYLSRTPASAGSRTTWTWSAWVKRSDISRSSGAYGMFGCSPSGEDTIRFDSATAGNQINYYVYTGGYVGQLNTTALYRDVASWYHIVCVWDTTNATSTDRMRMYINGSRVTAFGTATYPSLNAVSNINNNVLTDIGWYRPSTTTGYFDGYMSEVYFIDGQALTASSFGQTDSTTGIWIPKAYTGTYGTNGFYLNFSNSASLGTDASGNGNNFTVNNLTSVDQSKDHPTNNFATLNPLLYSTLITYTEGNLKFTNTATAQRMVASSIAPTTGKWYAECRVTSLGGNYPQIGVLDTSIYTMDTYVGALARGYGYASHGQVYNNAAALTTGLATYTTNDIIGVALDLDNNYVYFSKNGTFINSGVPTSGSSGTGGWAITDGYDYSFGSSSLDAGTDPVFDWNFGSPFYTVSGGYSDGNGYGNFTYQPPSGYLALCTNNLASNG